MMCHVEVYKISEPRTAAGVIYHAECECGWTRRFSSESRAKEAAYAHATKFE